MSLTEIEKSGQRGNLWEKNAFSFIHVASETEYPNRGMQNIQIEDDCSTSLGEAGAGNEDLSIIPEGWPLKPSGQMEPPWKRT